MEKNSTTEEMKTLTSCVNKLVVDGYTENFNATEEGLVAASDQKRYTPLDVTIPNFYRFEGPSDPSDNSILYVIETNDGRKGTLVDAYGPYADANVDSFMKEVEAVNKKPVHNDSAKN
ncbi:hypothetical protein JMG10_09460 [Nostoc ellipsosporum NOK]|nr:hypothetical protein [Nostoc ellipsosporum NOK]